MAERKVLLVGWDAADWKVIHPLIAAGKMPTVQRLVENGAAGQIATLHPALSPMLWTSIATGKRPFKHGIHGFSEPTPDGRGVQPISNLSRKSKALWNILNQSGLRSVLVGWWPSHPAEPIDGVMVSDAYHRATGPLDEGWPLPPNSVHPPELAAELAALRMHPDLLEPGMVEPFIPLANEIDQDRDHRLALFMRTLAECVSIHSAAMWLIENRPWDFFAVYFDAIDHFCHGFMRYHPPRQSWIPERDFEIYGNVVSMAYQLHDQMLGTLLDKAGEDVTVILMSDHGFHPDHLRPAWIPDIPAGPAVEHRDFGVLAIGGPGIKRGELLYGASILDVAPTILTLYGLPIGEDMDGKVLSQAFATKPNTQLIPSWENVPGADGRHPAHTRLDPVAAHHALEQMIALGYIDRPGENREIAVARTIRELRYNLGEAYQDAARHLEAHEIFKELCAGDPDEQRFAVRLFVSCQALGLHDEMQRIVADLNGRRRALFEGAKPRIEALLKAGVERVREGKQPGAGPEALLSEDERRELARWRNLARYQPDAVDCLKAQLLAAEKRYEEALSALERVPDPLQTADVLMRLHRWSSAEQIYRRALNLDPHRAQAHLGLCRVALHRGNFSEAAQSALNAAQNVHNDPQGHFLLGRALAGMKDYRRAAGAFRLAISINPNFPEAHIRLAALLEKHLGDAASAREHRTLARRMRNRRAAFPVAQTVTEAPRAAEFTTATPDMPPLEECLVVVTGLPRSGTSMLMQMLAAGGLDILSDGVREPDENNPRGYLEFEPVKNLLSSDSKWLFEARGKAVKIVVPLLAALPPSLACRVILSERNLDEVLDSQERMLGRSNPDRRRNMLKEEYGRALDRAKEMLYKRPSTQLLVIENSQALANPLLTASIMDRFLGGRLDVTKMAAAIDPALHRNRAHQLL